MSFNIILKKRNRWGSQSRDYVLIRGYKSRAKGQSPQISIWIPKGVVEELRWVAGDRATVALGTGEDEGKILLCRPGPNSPEYDHGYSLSGASNRKKNVGAVTNCDLRFTPTPEQAHAIYPNGFSSMRVSHEVTHVGLVLHIPGELCEKEKT